MGNSFVEKGLLKVSDDSGGFFIQCLLKKYFAIAPPLWREIMQSFRKDPC